MCLALMGFEELCFTVPPPPSHKNMTFLTMYTNILTFPGGENIDLSIKIISY